ncbi:MAG TPA: hypothetical protein VF119_00620 [Candidatus Limnocylindrales bacterium]
MDPEFPVDILGWMGPIFAFSLIVPLIITAAVIGVVVWSIRRGMPPRDDPAVAELKGRLARGEIDTAEYHVRLRALQDGDD